MAEVLEIKVKGDVNKTALDKQLLELEKTVKENADLAHLAGLNALGQAERTALHAEKALAWCKANELPLLSKEDIWVWHRWLPTSYYGSEGLDKYNYHEGVPVHVRRLMANVRGIFTALEIRTPERLVSSDPVLFGVIKWAERSGERPRVERVVLARWAESDANYVSFEDIKTIVKETVGLKIGIASNWADEPFSCMAAFMVLSAPVWFGGPLLLERIDFFGGVALFFASLTCAVAPHFGRLLSRRRMKRQFPMVAASI